MKRDPRLGEVGDRQGAERLDSIVDAAARICHSQLAATIANVVVVAFGAYAFNGLWAWISVGPPQFGWSLPYAGGLAYLALVGSVLTFPLYAVLLREWGPGKAAYNGVLIPVVAMALSTLFEGYAWTMLAAAGAMLAIAGLAVALSGRD